MSDEISYTEDEKKSTPPLQDPDFEAMKAESIHKLEKAQIDEQVRYEAGIQPIPSPAESVPRELPQMAFKMVSRGISCPKFELEDEEAKVFAHHLSVLIGAQKSWMFSIFIILIIVMGKLWICWDAIGKVVHRKQKEKTRAGLAAGQDTSEYI